MRRDVPRHCQSSNAAMPARRPAGAERKKSRGRRTGGPAPFAEATGGIETAGRCVRTASNWILLRRIRVPRGFGTVEDLVDRLAVVESPGHLDAIRRLTVQQCQKPESPGGPQRPVKGHDPADPQFAIGQCISRSQVHAPVQARRPAPEANQGSPDSPARARSLA